VSLRSRPHTFTILTMAELRDPEGAARVPSETTRVTALGQITPLKQEAAFRAFAVELKRPHLLLTDTSQVTAAQLAVGNEVIYGARRFRVESPVSVRDAGGSADHLSVCLEELIAPAA
jgi:hypothetical protein